jgi:tyramine---L-glutamate ligase
MASATRLFVYEYLSAGGAGDPRRESFAGLLAPGTAMRDALVADFAAIDGVVLSRATHDGEPAAGGLRVAAVSPREDEDAARFVAREAQAHDVALVVAPESDGILAALRRAAGDAHWLGCSSQAIAIASSKRATGKRLAGHGLSTPPTWEPGRSAVSKARGWVVKPDDGAGALDTRRHDRFDDARADLEQRLRRGKAATMERWIEGEPLSVSLMCGPGRTAILAINRQHIDVDAAGSVAYRGVRVAAIDPRAARAAALVDVAHRVAQAIPGLRGFIGIDVVDDPPRLPVVIEVNPRVTCAYVGLSAALGRNVAADMLAAHRVSCADHAAA